MTRTNDGNLRKNISVTMAESPRPCPCPCPCPCSCPYFGWSEGPSSGLRVSHAEWSIRHSQTSVSCPFSFHFSSPFFLTIRYRLCFWKIVYFIWASATRKWPWNITVLIMLGLRCNQRRKKCQSNKSLAPKHEEWVVEGRNWDDPPTVPPNHPLCTHFDLTETRKIYF